MGSFDEFLKISFLFFLVSYIDAGTGSLIIQMVIGFLAGGLLLLKIFWSKVRRKFTRSAANNKEIKEDIRKKDDLPEE